MAVFMPCKPPFLGAFLCGREWSSPGWKWLEVSFLACLEFVMAMQSIVSGCHYAIFYQISGQVLLWERCQEMITSINRNSESLVRKYRQLQIQEKVHNSSNRERILPVSLLSIPLVEILTGFALISLFKDANFIQTSIFMVTYIDIFLFGMIVVTSASSIFVKTEFWLNHVKPSSGKNVKYF